MFVSLNSILKQQKPRQRRLVLQDSLNSTTRDISRLRLRFLGVPIVAAALFISLRLYDLQGAQHQRWTQIAQRQQQAKVKIKGARGTIYDREGRTLGVSVEALAVAVHPKRWNRDSEKEQRLSTLTNVPVKEIRRVLAQDRAFVWLANGLPLDRRKELSALNAQALQIAPQFRRFYPSGASAERLIGRVGKDGHGLSGVELAFDHVLSAPSIELQLRRDARGRLLHNSAWRDKSISFSPISAENGRQLREQGSDLVLSIDTALQQIMESEFALARSESKAKQVFGVMLDAATGEVLALSQVGNQRGNEVESLRNAVLQDAFEPGSTFKPLVAAIALEHGVVGTREVLNCENGSYRVGPNIVRDVHPLGKAPLREVLVRSSNICMAKLGQRLGKTQLHAALQRLGFGEKTGIDLNGEAKGILRKPEKWYAIDEATHSFGQGISVTALQLARAYAALANGGKLLSVSLLKRKNPVTATPALSAKSATSVLEMLEGVISDEHGTAPAAKIAGLTIYGKTGTAQKPRKGGRGYDPERVLSSFIGIADGAELGVNRKLVLLVAVDEPGVKPRWGGRLAAPVFRRIVEQSMVYLMGQRLSSAGSVEETISEGQHG